MCYIYCDIPVNVSRYIHRVNIVDATVIVLGLRNLRRPDIQGKVSDRDAGGLTDGQILVTIPTLYEYDSDLGGYALTDADAHEFKFYVYDEDT